MSENTGEYAGLNVPPKIKSSGYKGVELIYSSSSTATAVRPSSILGGESAGLNRGFSQMDGNRAWKVGRVNVAAGACSASPAPASGWRCATPRSARPSASPSAYIRPSSSSSPTWPRRSTPRACSRFAPRAAARWRSDQSLQAGMAKLFASEAGRFCVEESFRIHGGYGYSKEYEIERLYNRDARRWSHCARNLGDPANGDRAQALAAQQDLLWLRTPRT